MGANRRVAAPGAGYNGFRANIIKLISRFFK
jgi:hypothetical protein